MQELFETIKETVQPFTDRQVDIPCFMKAQLFRDWFRTKTGAHNDDETYGDQLTVEMKKIVELVLQVGLHEPYDPNKVADLGTIMIGIFDLIIKAQDYWLTGIPEEMLKGA